jgi:uncharacterized membrane protein YcjF (UPF0283 family)
MEKSHELRDELLRQMDKGAGEEAPEASKRAVQAVLAKDARRLERLRRISLVSWIAFAAACLASGITGALTAFKSETWLIATIIGVQALLIVAVALTVALSFRSRTLRMKEIQAALAEIQDKLRSLSQTKAGGV